MGVQSDLNPTMFTVMPVARVLFLASLSLAAPKPSLSLGKDVSPSLGFPKLSPKTSPALMTPTISFQRRWKTKLQNFPMGYGSVSLSIHNGTIFVLNGAEVGNYVEQFDLHGNYLGEWPGWYNWPDEMVMGPRGELVVSALGAMDDQHMLAPGLVTYSSDGKFNHGFHKSSTGLSNPYGIAPYPGNSSRLLVADWGSNRTVVMQVDWTTGQLKMERNLTKVPYPFRLAASKDNLAVISMVCCETWQAPLLALRLFSIHTGELTRTVKQLEDGRTLAAPQTVAMDDVGRVLMVEGDGGLNSTLIFSPSGDHLGDLPLLGTPHKLLVQDGHLFSLTEEQGEDKMEVYINVYTYK